MNEIGQVQCCRKVSPHICLKYSEEGLVCETYYTGYMV